MIELFSSIITINLCWKILRNSKARDKSNRAFSKRGHHGSHTQLFSRSFRLFARSCLQSVVHDKGALHTVLTGSDHDQPDWSTYLRQAEWYACNKIRYTRDSYGWSDPSYSPVSTTTNGMMIGYQNTSGALLSTHDNSHNEVQTLAKSQGVPDFEHHGNPFLVRGCYNHVHGNLSIL